VTDSCEALRASPPPLAATAPDFSGLEAAIRLKSALLHTLGAAASADWRKHVARFAADLRSARVQDRMTLIVLLTELREELRLLIGGAERPYVWYVEVGAFPPESWVTLSADDVVGEFEREIIAWAVRDTTQFTSPVTRRVAAFLEEHYMEPLTLERVAAALGRSRQHLAAVFRRQMGITVHEYLTQLRLHAAMRLIRQGNKIEAVSLLVGYRSKKNLYRHFKEQLGVTPLAYKAALSRILPPTQLP
jgi:AraC-like DNA-binding protein